MSLILDFVLNVHSLPSFTIHIRKFISLKNNWPNSPTQFRLKICFAFITRVLTIYKVLRLYHGAIKLPYISWCPLALSKVCSWYYSDFFLIFCLFRISNLLVLSVFTQYGIKHLEFKYNHSNKRVPEYVALRWYNGGEVFIVKMTLTSQNLKIWSEVETKWSSAKRNEAKHSESEWIWNIDHIAIVCSRCFDVDVAYWDWQEIERQRVSRECLMIEYKLCCDIATANIRMALVQIEYSHHGHKEVVWESFFPIVWHEKKAPQLEKQLKNLQHFQVW